MGGGSGEEYSHVPIESEVRLTYKKKLFGVQIGVFPEKNHADLEKARADPDFVRYMISREYLDGEYYDRVFGGEDSDSDMDMSDDDVDLHAHSLSCFLSLSFFVCDALAECCSPSFSLFFPLSPFPDMSWLKSNFLISLVSKHCFFWCLEKYIFS